MSLDVSLRSRGPMGSAARTAKVLSRFGATPSLMARRLDRYEAITREAGTVPTWPTTACVLARHPALLRSYAERGIELAVHGLVHGDHSGLDRHEQREAIARATDIFERSGVRVAGFRGPYLRYNQATLEVLRELGLRYHCSQAVLFPMVSADPEPTGAYHLALKLYAPLDARRVAVRPNLRDGLVDMPVAIPDDEILTERLRLDDEARAAEWRHILDLTYERGDLFTIQLHPERITELGEALGATLANARRRRPHVFIARLDEIAAWWLRRSRFSLQVTRAGDGRYRVRLDADREATLLARGLDATGVPWYGRDVIVELRDFEADAARMPVVGVSRRSPAEVRRFLHEEGFPIEVSDEAAVYGAYVDVPATDWTESDVLAAIDNAPGPIVRISRWPEGARSALAVTGDIDALTLRDFILRQWETRGSTFARWRRSHAAP